MLNKFYKIIHSKYSNIFKFIFFLRYLFAIFFISLGLFLLIPNFFNYEKRTEFIKIHVIEKYDFKINSYESIKFKILPLPHLHLDKVSLNFKSSSNIFNIQNFKLFPKLSSIYNFENFKSNKLIFKNGDITLNSLDSQSFLKKILNQKNKLSINNLNLEITDHDKRIIKLEDINFANFGYDKNVIKGKIFGKKFKTQINNNLKNFNFKILDSGIDVDLNFKENAMKVQKAGSLKLKIINTNLKLEFDYDGSVLNIYNAYFRNKNLYFKNKSLITLYPFLDMNSNFIVEDVDSEFLEKINFHSFQKSINTIKKINSKNDIYFNSKKLSRGLVDEIKLKIDLVYGRLNYSKNFLIAKNLFQCDGDVNLLEEYPILSFDCHINFKDKKNFLKKFSITKKIDDQILQLYVKGDLNILNNRIKLKEVLMNGNRSSKEDLKYYKVSFEEILFNESLLKIFNSKKIKKFILEIS